MMPLKRSFSPKDRSRCACLPLAEGVVPPPSGAPSGRPCRRIEGPAKVSRGTDPKSGPPNLFAGARQIAEPRGDGTFHTSEWVQEKGGLPLPGGQFTILDDHPGEARCRDPSAVLAVVQAGEGRSGGAGAGRMGRWMSGCARDGFWVAFLVLSSLSIWLPSGHVLMSQQVRHDHAAPSNH
jgi:hypothetical protein